MSGGRTPPANVTTLAGTSKTNSRSSTIDIISEKFSNVNPSVKKTSENTAESSGNGVRYALSDSGKEYLEFKNADNKAPTVSPDIRYALREGAESDVERIVVCAPIKIGEADYYMGVMLQRDSRYQRLYLHNVVSVAIEREATSSSKDNLVTTGALENENHLSITSIIQKALNVKSEKQKNKNRASRRRPGCKNILRHNASHCLHY